MSSWDSALESYSRCNFPPPPKKKTRKLNMSFFSKILWEWKMMRCLLRCGPFEKAMKFVKKVREAYWEPKAEPFPGDAPPGCNLAFEKLPGLTPKKANKTKGGNGDSVMTWRKNMWLKNLNMDEPWYILSHHPKCTNPTIKKHMESETCIPIMFLQE